MNKLEALNQYLLFVKENKEYFNWDDPVHCNCGMFLQAINLYEEEDIEEAINLYEEKDIDEAEELAHSPSSSVLFDDYYSDIFKMYINPTCEVTNLSFTKVIDKLIAIGFTLNELINLECLLNTNFIVNPDRHKVDSLIQYITNWIKQEE